MMRILVGFCALGLVWTLGGCQKDESNSATGPGTTGYGTLVVRMMDAPAAYDEVNIAVDSVRVHIASNDTINGWYTISRTPAIYNLLDYVNGKDTIIAEDSIPAGYYSQLRLYIGTGSNIKVNGVTFPLVVPSGSQSGLKINIQTTIETGVKYVLRLDFNASRSIVVTGNGRYMLKPVIQAITTAISGSLTGIVVPKETHPTVMAVSGTDTSTTYADTSGAFRFSYLLQATYAVTIIPADTTYRDTTLINIAVLTGQNTGVGTIVLQKK